MFLGYNVKLIFKNLNRPPNSDELNIDCLPIGDSMSKPHNLKVLQSDTSKLKKQIKMLTVSLNFILFLVYIFYSLLTSCMFYLLFFIFESIFLLLFLKDPLHKKENYIIAVSIDKV